MLKVDIKELSITGKRALLSGINFEMKQNRIHTILGLNGSGKTTLIKSLTGLLNPHLYSVSGSVSFEGKDILSLDINELYPLRRDKIKYVFQDAVNSFNQLKTFEYYFNSFAKDKGEINAILSYFILPQYSELSRLYPYEVSGGMAQRIGLVLALAAHPEIIILDEPTSGIDSAISNLFLLKLKEFVSLGKNSVLLVTHDINFAEKISDEIAFLSDGRLSKFYSKKELFAYPDVPLSEGNNDKQGRADGYDLLRKLIHSYKQISL
jgi:peptide/nickel transport system ATP-binding protein